MLLKVSKTVQYSKESFDFGDDTFLSKEILFL